MACGNGSDNRGNELRRRERPSRIVHQHDVHVSRKRDQRTGHGFLAVITAGQYLDIAGDIELT
jgi:hypothetical protein